MTITVLPMDATAGAPAYSAKNARQAQAALYGNPTGRVFGTRSGWRVGTLSSIVSVTSTTWTLNPCACMIEPAAQLYQGTYGWASDQVITGAMTAADGTNPRIDILYIQVNDSSAGDGSGALSANVSYLAGTAAPSGTQVAPTLPPRSFLVATIAVPKSGGGSPTATLNQTYFVAAGAPVPVYSQTERDGLTPYDGFQVERRDVPGRPVETWDGTKYNRTSQMIANIGQGSSIPIIASGTIGSLTTNASGDGSITFPVAFPNALTAVTLTDASAPGSLGALFIKWTSASSDKTRITFRAYGSNGVALANLTAGNGLAIGYIATGY